MMSTPMDEAMHASVLRFVEAMHRPLDAVVLGPALLRELYFRVLTGAQGSAMRSALAMRGQFGRIGRSLRVIHADYAQPLDVPQLADEAGMSVPSFQPLQGDHAGVADAVPEIDAAASGTLADGARGPDGGSGRLRGRLCGPSQFSREFKRLFGLTPAKETQRMRDSFAIPEAFEDAQFVSSH